jgi:hypothetical protein
MVAYVSGSSGSVAGGSSGLSTLTLTLPAAVPVGNAVVAFFYGNASGGASVVPTITDNGTGNTYHNTNYVFNTVAGGNWFAGWFYGLSIQGSPTQIIWTRGAGDSQTYSFTSLVADVFSGVATSAALDGNAGQQQNSTGSGSDAQSSGAFVPGTAGDLIWGAMVAITGGTLTHGTGFTQGQTTSLTWITEYKLSGVSGSQTVTFTDSNAADQCLVGGFALLASLGGACLPTMPLLGVGCSIAVPPIYPLIGGAAVKLGQAVRRNATISRRSFLRAQR